MMRTYRRKGLVGVIGIVGLGLPLLWGLPSFAVSAFIASATGQVKLQRKDWKIYRPVRAGTYLVQGDLLWPAEGSRVKVVCPDLSQRSVKAGVPSGMKLVCPVWEVPIVKGKTSPGVLGGIDASVPYLISPRHTLLLNNSPSLYWNSVPGASLYTIQLNGINGKVKEYQSKANRFTLPTPLLPATHYWFTIQADTGESSQADGTSNLDFRILRPAEASVVQAKATQILQQKLNKQATALLLAEFYSTYSLPESVISNYGLTSQNFRSYTLTAEAITVLETLIQQGDQSPVVYRTLGDLYWQSGLYLMANETYRKAIELSTEPEDIEEKTLAQYGLGEINAATKQVDTAVQFYRQAKEGNAALGDARKIQFLDRLIENLTQQ
jgi:Tetratricopeptide repeat